MLISLIWSPKVIKNPWFFYFCAMINGREDPKCYHCGESCRDTGIHFDEKIFCCSGCRMVYEILSSSGAGDYYRLSEHPGIKANPVEAGNKFDFLDNQEIQAEILDFSDNGISRVKFIIPSIHCSSCIWLLENLHKLHPGIIHSSVHFTRKQATFTFRESEITLRKLVELLASLSYTPHISLASLDRKSANKAERGVYYKLGVAGFCFGNIMLFSFPSYLAIDDSVEHFIRQNFGLLNILLGIPVAFYSGSGYFITAYKGLKKRFISIDLPIALGISALFFRSLWEILSGTGPGFMDSLAGLVFFLLIGKWYQGMTYQALSFERDYRSYFPVAVTLVTDPGIESILPLKKLKTGMRILIRNNELIPADAILVKGEGAIDYSFVTGESAPVLKREGQRIFAGGKQSGAAIEILIEKEVTQSKLTELWNEQVEGNERENLWESAIDIISRYFTAVVLILSVVSGIIWWIINPSEAILVVTSILIVACPCALAMTLPFSFGGAMRVFGRNGFFVKRSAVVEVLSKIDTIVLDKTGTLTNNQKFEVDKSALLLRPEEYTLIRSLVRHSTHPLSVAIFQLLGDSGISEVSDFREIPSKGLEGIVRGRQIKLGSEDYVCSSSSRDSKEGRVFISIDGVPSGYVSIGHQYREGMKDVLTELAKDYELHLLSGDNDAEMPKLLNFFPNPGHLRFNQSPLDKLNYIRDLKTRGHKVLMIGDGLNDAGALREADCGLSVADEVYHFSPACDAILEARRFNRLSDFLKFSKTSRKIVIMSITLSFLYNIVGLSYAVTGHLAPIVSAILMPLSSVSVILFITISVFLASVYHKLNSVRAIDA